MPRKTKQEKAQEAVAQKIIGINELVKKFVYAKTFEALVYERIPPDKCLSRLDEYIMRLHVKIDKLEKEKEEILKGKFPMEIDEGEHDEN